MPAQTFETIATFVGTDGTGPIGPLVQDVNGDFYGVTVEGGVSSNCTYKYGCGVVFEVTPSGKITDLYNFCSQVNCTDGAFPFAGLVRARNFYGTTSGGGIINSECSGGCGTVFEITPAGKLATLYSFCSQAKCTDGVFPDAALRRRH